MEMGYPPSKRGEDAGSQIHDLCSHVEKKLLLQNNKE